MTRIRIALENTLQPRRRIVELLLGPAHGPGAASRFLQEHYGLVLILILSFALRFMLSGWNSYRLDELYSVKAYGTDYQSVWDGVRALAENSVHPPLFQIVLFYWVKIFGDTEVATRALPNLYVTAATVLVYLFCQKAFGKRVAIASCLLFVLAKMTLQWGLDTRSYAQSLFLSTLSSYFLIEYLESLRGDLAWNRILANRHYAGLAAANVGLLFTHYYNVFFLAAQGAFVLYYFGYEGGAKRTLHSFGKVALLYGIQLALFLGSWGWVMLGTLGRYHGSKYTVDSPTDGPLALFHTMVVGPNLGGSGWVTGVVLILMLILLAGTGRGWFAQGSSAVQISRHVPVYLAFATLGPSLVAYVLFWLSHAERLEPRYFIVSTAPLMIVVALALDGGIQLPAGSRDSAPWLRFARRFLGVAAVVVAVAVLGVVGARGYEAAAWHKRDFRGIAADIADLVRGDPNHRYIIYEVSSFPRPMLDFYLNRGKPPLSAYGTVLPTEEASGKFQFEQEAAAISQHDFLVLAFPHRRVRTFPLAILRLEQSYRLFARHEDLEGFGYLIFEIHPGP